MVPGLTLYQGSKPPGKTTDTRLYLNHLNIRWVEQKHGIPFVMRTSIIKKEVDRDQEIGTGSSHHSTIHSAVNLGKLHPCVDRNIANVSAGGSLKAASSDKYELVRSLETHWPTSVTLCRRLAPFVSSAHATQTYNQKHMTSNLCHPSDLSPLISVPHIMENPSDASKRICLDMWPSDGIRKVWCKTHLPLSFVTYTGQMSLSRNEYDLVVC